MRRLGLACAMNRISCTNCCEDPIPYFLYSRLVASTPPRRPPCCAGRAGSLCHGRALRERLVVVGRCPPTSLPSLTMAGDDGQRRPAGEGRRRPVALVANQLQPRSRKEIYYYTRIRWAAAFPRVASRWRACTPQRGGLRVAARATGAPCALLAAAVRRGVAVPCSCMH